jgi:hypothetical protein
MWVLLIYCDNTEEWLQARIEGTTFLDKTSSDAEVKMHGAVPPFTHTTSWRGNYL